MAKAAMVNRNLKRKKLTAKYGDKRQQLKTIILDINKSFEEKENARIMWRNFVSRNVVCKYWVNKENKWVLENSS